MKLSLPVVAWLSVAGACIAWAGVIFFAFTIQNISQEALTLRMSAQAASTEQTTALQIRAFAKQTAPAYTEFENVLTTDPVSLAGVIAQAGKDAGTVLKVDNASPEDTAAPTSGTNASTSISTIDFTL